MLFRSELNLDSAVKWLHNGAQPTETAKAILSYKGALYKKHLLRGVAKGSFTMDVAEQKFVEWQKTHEGSVMDHVKKVEAGEAAKKAAEIARINNKRLEEASKKAAAEKEAADAAEAAAKAAEVTTEEATAEVENVAENTEATTEETTNE